jgi:hypothetical protein
MQEQLSEIQRSLGKIEGALPAFTARVERIEEDVDGLGKRLRSVEHWRWYLGGAIALGGATLTGFVFL